MTLQEKFEEMLDVVQNKSGKEIADYFNNELEKVKNDNDKLLMLLTIVRKFRYNKMSQEDRDVCREFEKIIIQLREELQNK